ncbi:unnamed protein product [Caenorhabditis bovis]|uniref:Uncharacterized protein n=1 Tax=Caenorhabditis bovis TaxID=2654633 RepID=A0A8S1F2D8_9PELO|nr:unnamed protein product [Caenorhabditis bovis]
MGTTVEQYNARKFDCNIDGRIGINSSHRIFEFLDFMDQRTNDIDPKEGMNAQNQCAHGMVIGTAFENYKRRQIDQFEKDFINCTERFDQKNGTISVEEAEHGMTVLNEW